MKATILITRSLKTLIMILITITLPFGCNLEKQEDLEDIVNIKKKSEISELTNSDEFQNLQKAISQFGKVIGINYRKLSRTKKELFRNQLTAITTVDCIVLADSLWNMVSSIIKVDLKPYLDNINNQAYLLRAKLEENEISIEEFQDELSTHILSLANPGNLKKSGVEYDPECMEGCYYGLLLGTIGCSTVAVPAMPLCLAVLAAWYASCVVGCEI